MIAKDKLSKVLVCLALALGTTLLYLPVLHFDFVNYDDPIYVIDNFHIRTLSWQSLGWCFQAGYASLWHPLTWMSHLLDFQLYGLKPGGHHATSVVLHIFNSVLLFVVLNRMTKALWPSAMVAALFAWHPLHVESVAWVSERKDVLSAFFWMLTIWAYVRYVEQRTMDNVEHGKRGGQQRVFYGLALFFFALGLMAKPMVVTLPFVLLLLDWWPLQRVRLKSRELAGSRSSSLNPNATTMARLLIEKIPFLVFSLIACAMTLKAAGGMVEPLAQFPLPPRIVNALLTYFRYVEKMVWPTDLVAVYPLEFHWSAGEMMMAALFLAAVSVTAFRLRETRAFWLTGWLLYLGMLFPVIGLVQVGAQPMGDHYTYLPSIGIFIIICWEVRDMAAGWQFGRATLGTMGALVLGACLILSAKQLEFWRNPVTLFSHNLAVTPDNFIVHADYAAFLCDSSQLEPARKEAEKAVRLSPNYGWAHHVLGVVFLRQGKYPEADAELRTALRLDASRMDVHLALGQVALRRNLPGVAAAEYGVLLASEHSNVQALVGLGQSLAMQGKLEEARVQLVEAVRLAPRYPEAHHQLAVVIAFLHHPAEAVSQYRTTLELQPDRADTLNNLAWILATDSHAEIRHGAEAEKFAAAACTLTHDQDPLLLGTLAAAYAENGNFEEAVATAQQAHDLALRQGKKDIADRNVQLLELYRAHQPYHEK